MTADVQPTTVIIYWSVINDLPDEWIKFHGYLVPDTDVERWTQLHAARQDALHARHERKIAADTVVQQAVDAADGGEEVYDHEAVYRKHDAIFDDYDAEEDHVIDAWHNITEAGYTPITLLASGLDHESDLTAGLAYDLAANPARARIVAEDYVPER